MNGEEIFHSALDEPSPPKPPESIEDDDGDNHHRCPFHDGYLVNIYKDGSVIAENAEGALLCAWFVATTVVTVGAAVYFVWLNIREIALLAVTGILYVVLGAAIIGGIWFLGWVSTWLAARLPIGGKKAQP